MFIISTETKQKEVGGALCWGNWFLRYVIKLSLCCLTRTLIYIVIKEFKQRQLLNNIFRNRGSSHSLLNQFQTSTCNISAGWRIAG